MPFVGGMLHGLAGLPAMVLGDLDLVAGPGSALYFTEAIPN